MAIELEDGTVVLSLPEQVEQNKAKVEEVDIKVDNLTARVEAALAGILHFKGSVATYSDLPADAEIGDVYNVIDTGADYAWTGSEWDELGSVVDLSKYVTLDGAQTITGDKTFDDANVEFVISNALSYQLGKDLGYFSIARNHVSQMLFGSFSAFLKGTFYPYQDNVYNLGGSSYKWKDLYLSGKTYLYDANNYIEATASYLLLKSSSNIVFNPTYNVLPAVDASTDLGSSSYKWKDLYLKSYIDFGDGARIHKDSSNRIAIQYNNADKIKVASTNTIISNRLDPDSDNFQDIGRSTSRWKDIYLSGVLSNGTNSVNVADLKALIDYAKAQGWIS